MSCAFSCIATDADLLPFFISKCPMSVPWYVGYWYQLSRAFHTKLRAQHSLIFFITFWALSSCFELSIFYYHLWLHYTESHCCYFTNLNRFFRIDYLGTHTKCTLSEIHDVYISEVP